LSNTCCAIWAYEHRTEPAISECMCVFGSQEIS